MSHHSQIYILRFLENEYTFPPTDWFAKLNILKRIKDFLNLTPN